MGGVRALRLWSQITGAPTPDVYHANEGHAGFLGVERISELVRAEAMSFDEALEAVRSATVFTTHTPVPAGIDRFDASLIELYFGGAQALDGVPVERLLQPRRRDLRGRLGRHVQHGRHGPAPRPARQRRLAAARRRQPRDVRRPVAGLRRRRGADHLASPTACTGPPGSTARSSSWPAPTPTCTSSTPRSRGRRSPRCRGMPCGPPSASCACSSSRRPGAAPASRGSSAAPRRPSSAGPTRSSTPTCSPSGSPAGCPPTSGSP